MSTNYHTEQDMADQEAWHDWRRVERCLYFGVRQWGVTIALIWWAEKDLDGWLAFAAAMIVLTGHFLMRERIDTRLEAAATRIKQVERLNNGLAAQSMRMPL
jgi:hypothetical protein